MGRRRKPRRSRANAQLLAALSTMEGSRIPGGCDHCNAYQTVQRDPDHPRITHLTTHHDDTCPFLARYEGRA